MTKPIRSIRSWREEVRKLAERPPSQRAPTRPSFVRTARNGSPKGFQFHPEAIRFFGENPAVIIDFLDLRLQARQTTGRFHRGPLSVELFDPKDESSKHSFLYKVRFKAKTFFVKEVRDPTYPIDSVTQFAVHDRLNQLSHELEKWNARVLPYHLAWNSRKESFAVSDWTNGVTLEKWLQSNPGRTKDEVYQRFFRIERFLRRQGAKDVTTRNTIYNPKTDELVLIDLHPR